MDAQNQFSVVNGRFYGDYYSMLLVYPMIEVGKGDYFMNSPIAKDMVQRIGFRNIAPEVNNTIYIPKRPLILKIIYKRFKFGKQAKIGSIRIHIEGEDDDNITIMYKDIVIFNGRGKLLDKIEDTPFSINKIKTKTKVRRITK